MVSGVAWRLSTAAVSWQHAAESWLQTGASASAFSVLVVLPAQATSIAATAATANRFFIIVYLILLLIDLAN